MNKPKRLAHISPADLHQVYDAFLRGRACISPKVEIYLELTEGLTGERIPRNIPRLASVDAMRQHREKFSWTHMLAEVANDGALSPVAYLRHDGTVHGLVRDYSVEHVNALSLLVGNGDILTGEIIATDHTGQARTHTHTHTRSIIAWTWGGRGVTTHDYLTISAPLMTQVYRLTKHPEIPKTPKTPKKRAKSP